MTEDCIRDAWELVISNSQFEFDEVFFEQVQGAPIGNQASVVFGNNFAFKLLRAFLPHAASKGLSPYRLWRLIDDIIGFWPGTFSSLLDFVTELNTFSSSHGWNLEFKLTSVGNGWLNPTFLKWQSHQENLHVPFKVWSQDLVWQDTLAILEVYESPRTAMKVYLASEKSVRVWVWGTGGWLDVFDMCRREVCVQGVPYLDLEVYLAPDAGWQTRIFSKPTDVHAYLHISSCHPPHVHKNIPYGVAQRIRRICSEPREFHLAKETFTEFFMKRGYAR